MENNLKSRKINMLSRHKPLTNENVENVWEINYNSLYKTETNAATLAEVEELGRFKKAMINGEMKFDAELYKQVEEQLKKESNKAMRLFNKPKTANKKRHRIRRTRRQARN